MIRLISITIYTTALFSCSFLQGSKQLTIVNGKVTVTKYLLPVPCRLSFYVNNKLSFESETNQSGEYQIEVKEKMLNRKGYVIIEPLKNGVSKDTNITASDIIVVQGIGLEKDTFYYNTLQSVTDFQLKKYQLFTIFNPSISH